MFYWDEMLIWWLPGCNTSKYVLLYNNQYLSNCIPLGGMAAVGAPVSFRHSRYHCDLAPFLHGQGELPPFSHVLWSHRVYGKLYTATKTIKKYGPRSDQKMSS